MTDDGWSAIRVSYGLCGIVILDRDICAVADYLWRHQVTLRVGFTLFVHAIWRSCKDCKAGYGPVRNHERRNTPVVDHSIRVRNIDDRPEVAGEHGNLQAG